jgi:hypothetical protein
VHVGSEDNYLYSLNSNASLGWSYQTGYWIDSSPAIGSDGRVYFGSYDGRLYSLNSNASLGWSYQTMGSIYSSPAIGSDGKLYFGSEDSYFYAIQQQPTATPTNTPTNTSTKTPTSTPTRTPTSTPNYVELHVQPNGSGGYDFYPGQSVILGWASYEDLYNYRNVPCAIYLAAAFNPPTEDRAVSVDEIVRSGALFLFDKRMRPVRYNPKKVKPTWTAVPFPVPGLDSGGSLPFTVPSGAGGRWAFATVFVRLDNGQFPAQPPVEVSNGFNLH